MSDVERPWGLGNDNLDSLWARLTQALASDPDRLNRIIAEELTESERVHIIESLVPLIFALPLRSYPAELRATNRNGRLVLNLRTLDVPPKPSPKDVTGVKHAKPAKDVKEKDVSKEEPASIGHLPSALTGTFSNYLRRVLRWPENRHRAGANISSGGRRRRVRVSILAHDKGVVIRFLERLPSPVEDNL